MTSKNLKQRLSLLCLGLAAMWPVLAGGQSGPGGLQKHAEAQAAEADLRSSRTIRIALSSRRVDDAVSPVRASNLYGQVTKAMRKTPLKPVMDATSADLSLDVIVESHGRWGRDRSKDDPYIFLLLRDRSSASLLYCGYRRVGLSYGSAMGALLDDLSARTKAVNLPSNGDISACAAEAKRPVDLPL